MKTQEPAKKKNNEFGTPEKVDAVIKPMQEIEAQRALDRALINNLFNGKQPYTAEEEKKHQIKINVNWGEGKRIMRDANNQLNTALLHPGILFNCTLKAGRLDKREEWSQKFTQLIHEPIQEGDSGRLHSFLIRNRNATICMHGIGALLWTLPDKWFPRYIPLEDLLIPSGTFCDFSNMRYFAVNLYLTPGELVSLTHGDKVHKGWNMEMVHQILDSQKNLTGDQTSLDWRYRPEEMTQIMFENKGFYWSDITPKIRCRYFFYQQVDEPKKWYRMMLLREAYGEAKPGDKFLFDGSDEPFAENISQILAVQYGDGNYVAPLDYHAVRSLGVDLYAPVETLNRLRCEYVQSVFEHLKMYFRIQDPQDRDRLKQIVLTQYGVLPEGLNIVKRDERHQIDPRLVDDVLSQMRQITQESSSSFIKDINDGTSKEMTAQEARIRLNQANAMVSAMISSLYLQEGFLYQEYVRRFCLPNSSDPQIKSFRERCIKAGIPEDLLHSRHWKVTPERVLGGGDKSTAEQQAMWLWDTKNDFDPAVQPKIKRLVVGTLLNNFDKAKEFVPDAPVTATNGVIAAEDVFGTLMTGNQCVLRQGIDQQGYIETLLRMMASVIQRIAKTSNVGTVDELIGLQTVAQNIQQHMMVLARDEKERQRVKQYGDALGQMTNAIKGFAQRLAQQQQAAQQEPGGDPKAAAAAQTQIMLAQIKAKVQADKAQQAQRHKDLAFQLDQQRQNLSLAADVKREDLLHQQEMLNSAADKSIELLHALRSGNKVDESSSVE